MRESCIKCFLKHLSQVCVLLDEAKMGYPLHFWFAMGHLAEASSESIGKWPNLANRVRALRLNYTDNGIGFDDNGELLAIMEEAFIICSSLADHK